MAACSSSVRDRNNNTSSVSSVGTKSDDVTTAHGGGNSVSNGQKSEVGSISPCGEYVLLHTKVSSFVPQYIISIATLSVYYNLVQLSMKDTLKYMMQCACSRVLPALVCQ